MTAPAVAKILVSENLADSMPELGDRYSNLEIVRMPLHGGAMSDDFLGADVMFRSALDEDLFDDILRANDRLRWIQIAAAGFDWMGGPELERRAAEGLQVTRSGNSYDAPIAEYAIGAMLAMSRHFVALHAAQQRHEWIRTVSADFAGSTVGIFGTGAIGKEIAWRTAALGATPVGVSRSGRPTEHFTRVVRTEDFHQVLPQCRYVVLAMPLTPETRHMFSDAEFGLMRDDAFLVNVGRGALTDEDALLRALHAGTIGGAVLDAFVTEPLPADSPWWDAPNALITPHCSFRAESSHQRLWQDFCRNLDRWTAGDPLVGTMKEPTLGY